MAIPPSSTYASPFQYETYTDILADAEKYAHYEDIVRLRTLQYLLRVGSIPNRPRPYGQHLFYSYGFLLISVLFALVLIVLAVNLDALILSQLQQDPVASVAAVPSLQIAVIAVAFIIPSILNLPRINRLVHHYTQKQHLLRYIHDQITALDTARLSAVMYRSPREQADFRRAKLLSLDTKVGSVLVDNKDERTRARRASSRANRLLSLFYQMSSIPGASDETAPTYGQLTPTQSEYLSNVDQLIGSIETRIARELLLQGEQQSWRRLFLLGIVVYLALLLAVIALMPQEYFNVSLRNTGIPASIFVWGVFGSLGAILYKFYKMESAVRFHNELRWLIARPVIGIIMAGLSYLAVISGLIVANTAVGGADGASPADPTQARMELFWVLAFLAGFSDKFYEGIINALVQRTSGDDTAPPGSNGGAPPPEDEEALLPESVSESIFETNIPAETTGSAANGAGQSAGPVLTTG